MERADLLAANAQIFTAQGKALDASASRNVKVLVVGNPANTNAYIAMKSAPGLPRENFTAMLRLDHNRALSQIAAKTGKPVAAIQKLAVWGNHSPEHVRRLPLRHHRRRQSVKDMINDHAWNKDVFLPTVGKRGAAIIEARGLSSAAVGRQRRHRPHARLGAGHRRRVGHDGRAEQRRIRHPEGRDVRLPGHLRRRQVQASSRAWPIDEFSQGCIDKTLAELMGEQDGVKHLL